MILQIFPILENLIHQYREGAGRGEGRKNGDRGEGRKNSDRGEGRKNGDRGERKRKVVVEG